MIYHCAECGGRAAEIIVSFDEVRREAHTGVMLKRIGPELRERVVAALDDPGALLEIDLELAPFWCPECRASYCADHWRRELVFDDDPLPAWLDSIRAECPYGHERMVED